MKKIPIFLVILTLGLAGIACNFPHKQIGEIVPEVSEPVTGFQEEKRVNEDGSITLLVPDSYYVGSSTAELTNLVENIDAVQVNLSGLFALAQENIRIWGYDTNSTADVPTSFVVIKSEEFAAMPLGLISTLALPLIGNDVVILQETRMTIAGRDTLRWITTASEAGLELSQVVYVFKESGGLYLVVFNADQQEASHQLNNYDFIVSSLRVEDLN